ncbi:methyltransferase domain-containing protein [Paenibacillus sp. OAS669]|uniref:class I SAM-dependent methyltransferase n=1 Tax=Paenibacillus sp. OAS669 TaxID=2663821 RepID=UPI001CEEFF9E
MLPNPWKSQFDEPNAENIFGQRLSSAITANSRVLDIGCGSGDFLSQYALIAQEAVGIDNKDAFIATANRRKPTDRFCYTTVDVDQGLPFPAHYVDIVFSKGYVKFYCCFSTTKNRLL